MSAATAAEDSKRGGAKLDHSLDEESNKEPLKVHTVKVVEAEEVEKEEKGGEDTCENREKFGKKAIEELASELNKAAHTIREFTQNVSSTHTDEDASLLRPSPIHSSLSRRRLERRLKWQLAELKCSCSSWTGRENVHPFILLTLFPFQECDEEILKQLNDEQLLRLLEEAYHSKKLDEKNKTSIFKVLFLQC